MGKRYWIDFVIIAMAMGTLLLSMCMTLFLSQIPNHIWNSVLNCSTSFPTTGNVFSGKYLACPAANVVIQHYREKGRRFSGHEVFALLLQVLVFVVGFIAVAPTWFKKKYRVAPYLVNMELVYGSLGLFTLPSVIALSFALQEYYSNIVNMLNDDEFTEISSILELDSNATGQTVSMSAKSWRSIEAACAIKDKSIRWSGVVDTLDSNLIASFTNEFSTKDITFKGEAYDHHLLKRLGFCPYLSELDVAAGALVISTLCFFVLPLTNLCFKHSTSVSATNLQNQANPVDEEAEEDDDADLTITEAASEWTVTETASDGKHLLSHGNPSEKSAGAATTATTYSALPSSTTIKTVNTESEKNKPKKKEDLARAKENFRHTLNSFSAGKGSVDLDLSTIKSDLSALYEPTRKKKKAKKKKDK